MSVVDALADGPVRLAGKSHRYLVFGFHSRRIEPREQAAFHSHNEIELLLVERGGIEQLTGGRVVSFSPGRLAVFWGAIPHHAVRIAPGTVLHRLTVPLAWFLGWQLPAPFNQALFAGTTLIEPDERRGPAELAQFLRWHEDLEEGSAGRRKLVLLECEARLRRLHLAIPSGAPAEVVPAPALPGLERVERISRFVALHYQEPLRLADIGRDAGLNAEYAGVLFRKVCGVSLVDFITGYRVSHAQRLLATTDAKIVEIAYEAGFGAPSRFYSAFKKACGRTPRAYRRAMALAPSA